MTESEGKALLAACFTEAGYHVDIDVPFSEDGIRVELDGWDGEARVGFEFITAEADDRLQFDAATLEKLEARIARGELALLLVDEHEALTPAALEDAARAFLGHLVEKRRAP